MPVTEVTYGSVRARIEAMKKLILSDRKKKDPASSAVLHTLHFL